MMVYNIDVARIQVKVMDHARREQFFLDPQVNMSENITYKTDFTIDQIHRHRDLNRRTRAAVNLGPISRQPINPEF